MKILSVLAFAFFGIAVGPFATAERPNFIIFVADDMAYNDCGAYGHPSIRTPNIDALAKSGMRFDRAYLTCSSCSPSRCSMLTGRYPHSTGAGELHLPLSAEQTLLTTPLREAGYWTAAVGKWHLGDDVKPQVDYIRSSSPQKMGDAWVTALQERDQAKPFFLWAAHSDPHRGYKPGAIDPPHVRSDARVPEFLPDTPIVRDDLALYYDEIGRFDKHIGETLAELERQGLTENTFVLVISDNGRPFPYCKTMVHVPGVRTPFVVRWPANVNPSTICRSVVSTLDIAPTVLELAQLQPLDSFQGVSLAKLLSNPQERVRDYAFAEHNWHDYRAFERGVHSGQYCYVRNWLPNIAGTPPADAVKSVTFREMKRLRSDGKLATLMEQTSFATPRPTEFLYDVNSDPQCIQNLASSPEHVKVMEEMREVLEDWQSETGDTFDGEGTLTPDGFDRLSGDKQIKKSHPSFD